jgi:hypothetical protein
MERPDRDEMARALAERLRSGEWVALLGGPGIGKTTLAEAAVAGVPDVVRLSVTDAPGNELAGKTALFDDLDRLEPSVVELVLQRLVAARPKAALVTGGRALRRQLPGLRALRPLGPYPVGVLREGEARGMCRALPEEQIPTLLDLSGCHPTLTALLLESWDAGFADPTELAVRAVAERCASWCVSVARQVRGPGETALLDYLVLAGEPRSVAAACRSTGQPRLSAAGDLLAMLGVVMRVEADGQPALHARSRLFNNWWKRDRGLA